MWASATVRLQIGHGTNAVEGPAAGLLLLAHAPDAFFPFWPWPCLAAVPPPPRRISSDKASISDVGTLMISIEELLQPLSLAYGHGTFSKG